MVIYRKTAVNIPQVTQNSIIIAAGEKSLLTAGVSWLTVLKENKAKKDITVKNIAKMGLLCKIKPIVSVIGIINNGTKKSFIFNAQKTKVSPLIVNSGSNGSNNMLNAATDITKKVANTVVTTASVKADQNLSRRPPEINKFEWMLRFI